MSGRQDLRDRYDDRPDERAAAHVDIGTEIEVPHNKLKGDRANPTRHGILFLSVTIRLCYVQPGVSDERPC